MHPRPPIYTLFQRADLHLQILFPFYSHTVCCFYRVYVSVKAGMKEQKPPRSCDDNQVEKIYAHHVFYITASYIVSRLILLQTSYVTPEHNRKQEYKHTSKMGKNPSPGTLNHTSPDIAYRQWIEATLLTIFTQRDSSLSTYIGVRLKTA